MQIHVLLRQRGWAYTDMSHVGFLVYLKFLGGLFFSSHRACTRGLILTLYTSYDVFPHKEVRFGVALILHPISGVRSPPNPILGVWIGIFKPKMQNIKICILLKLRYQF